jgi:hypothetical protein
MAALAAVAVVGVVGFLATGVKEPEHRGIPLRQWLCDFDSQTLFLKQEATAAVEAMGTTSLPTLVVLLEKRDSPLKQRFVALADRQSLVPLRHTPASAWHLRAMKACRVLGPSAQPAVPALMDLLADPQLGHEAAATLADVQGELFPLTRAATNHAFSAEIRMRAARRLAAPVYAQRPDTLIALRIATRDQVASVRSEAVMALTRLEAASESSLNITRNSP